ncbi:hypothetical protein HZC09_03465 [Candidatus Micrarchaeota archaeon]|nr:hypothetical protein [Candidatus Micrarchaeota archaeon]
MTEVLIEVSELARLRTKRLPPQEPPRSPDFEVKIKGRGGHRLSENDAVALAELLKQTEALENHPFSVEQTGGKIRKFRRIEELNAMPHMPPQKMVREQRSEMQESFADYAVGKLTRNALKKMIGDSKRPEVDEFQLTQKFYRDPAAARIIATFAANFLKKRGYEVEVKGICRPGD